MAETALAGGYHVLLEGIMAAHRYGDPLRNLINDHPGGTHVYYLDVSFDETVRRHATRPLSAHFTAAEMRGWYRRRDTLGVSGERVVPESSTLDQTVELISQTSGLRHAAAAAPCPSRCDGCVLAAESITQDGPRHF